MHVMLYARAQEGMVNITTRPTTTTTKLEWRYTFTTPTGIHQHLDRCRNPALILAQILAQILANNPDHPSLLSPLLQAIHHTPCRPRHRLRRRQ